MRKASYVRYEMACVVTCDDIYQWLRNSSKCTPVYEVLEPLLSRIQQGLLDSPLAPIGCQTILTAQRLPATKIPPTK